MGITSSVDIDLNALTTAPFETSAVEGKEKLPGSRPIAIRISEQGVHFFFERRQEVVVPLSQISGWEFCEKVCIVTYSGKVLKSTGAKRLSKESCGAEYVSDDWEELSDATVAIEADPKDIRLLQKQFNLLRIREYVLHLSSAEMESLDIRCCGSCELLYNSIQAPSEGCSYCAECLTILKGQKSLCLDNEKPYNFCASGFFALLGHELKKGLYRLTGNSTYTFQGFDNEVRPAVAKLLSHFLWACLWLIIIASLWYPVIWGWMPPTFLEWVRYAIYGFMALTLVNVFFFGYYATGLLIRGGVSTLISPPPWERVFRFSRDGKMDKALSLMEEKNLLDHPGLLANVALGCFKKKSISAGWDYLKKALALCPSHPALLVLAHTYAPNEEKVYWKQKLEVTHLAQQLFIHSYKLVP